MATDCGPQLSCHSTTTHFVVFRATRHECLSVSNISELSSRRFFSRKPPEAASNPVPVTPPIFSKRPAATLSRHAPRRRRGSGLAPGRPRAAGPTTRARTARLAAAHNEPSIGVSGRTPPHSPRRHATQAALRRIITQRRNQQDIPPEGHESPAEARPGRPGATAVAKHPPDNYKGLHSYPS